MSENRQRRTANEIDHIVPLEEESKTNKKKGKKNEEKKGETNKEKDKKTLKSKNSLINSDDEESMSGSNLLTKNFLNLINKKARPLSMANIFNQKESFKNNSKSNFIVNFINYSIKDRTKEEHEKKLKEKWEEKDNGRSKLAIKSRLKFLIFAKNLKKEKLDENEKKF